MNMKVSRIKLISMLMCFLVAIACKETLKPEPVKKGDKPGKVSQYTSESIPGGAIITFKVPASPDLRYVKATYTLNTGLVREAKSTVYTNTILVDGFSKAGDYQITLVAVSVGEVESDPVFVKITALTPSHQAVVDDIRVNKTMYATFGGINVDYKNEMEENLVIRVLTKDEKNNWMVASTAYTKAKNGRLRLRGYPPVEREFAVYVTDRWNNKSDTLYRSLTPIYEIKFNKALFKEVNLPGDTYTPHSGASRARAMPILWSEPITSATIFHTQPISVMPQHFTFDMGVKAKLSRYIFYSDANSNAVMFGPGTPSVWELWGSNNPNPDGSFASWTKVGKFNSIKPSGLPLGQLSDADIAQCKNGEEFEVDPVAGAYRYWRWRSLENWGNLSYIYMARFTFFGSAEN
ncbi:MAG: DUF5000 domain-containing lipoprotein [Candidatus Pedobacter colombiensis]|uniref:DUF5000 domain-containing lipoprotein n=1 Tax=Candidatus Pedobacter colombiensis TaxID=3121371 RepID=A0AAJ6B5M5_9SPHI|nr:DUF5000 domain-containing lipoprotein [Pedobacter sp.]WEK17641.1 MAG: DUF5000 domain-containing lipoprotein [Pedobacter sp.]